MRLFTKAGLPLTFFPRKFTIFGNNGDRKKTPRPSGVQPLKIYVFLLLPVTVTQPELERTISAEAVRESTPFTHKSFDAIKAGHFFKRIFCPVGMRNNSLPRNAL